MGPVTKIAWYVHYVNFRIFYMLKYFKLKNNFILLQSISYFFPTALLVYCKFLGRGKK